MLPVDWMPPETPPQVATCVMIAAREYQLPPLGLLGVLKKEGGKVGTVRRNKNGTYDMGPMQINSRWLDDLGRYGITSSHLTYDLCTNIRAGAWRLKSEVVRVRGDFWRGVGNYHSRTPVHHDPYKRDVIKIITRWMQAAGHSPYSQNNG